ncbi:unnamed protein product [Somion occarium]|uniref:Uncharacterized protein n=1 Tax=Somion occarium TaxID=3059160 RepID=A0ABP1DEQ1_9APHY
MSILNLLPSLKTLTLDSLHWDSELTSSSFYGGLDSWPPPTKSLDKLLFRFSLVQPDSVVPIPVALDLLYYIPYVRELLLDEVMHCVPSIETDPGPLHIEHVTEAFTPDWSWHAWISLFRKGGVQSTPTSLALQLIHVCSEEYFEAGVAEWMYEVGPHLQHLRLGMFVGANDVPKIVRSGFRPYTPISMLTFESSRLD